jgi:arginine:pyruvate transaminase
MKTSKLIKKISGPASKAWLVGDKAFEMIDAGKDVIHLGIGDPDFDTPKQISSLLKEAIDNNKTHYSPLAGENGLRQEIASHAMGLYGGDIKKENIAVLPGAQAALFSAFLCLAERGDEVIVLEPTYATYPAVIQASGAKIVTVKLDEKTGYQLNVSDIKRAITSKTKAILINSPSNPSGAVFKQDTLNALADLCKRERIWLVTDEVYWSLTYEDDHASAFFQNETRANVIVINSLSKSHAMTGWRVGWVIAPEEIIDALTSLSQAQYFGVSQFIQLAAIEALRDKKNPQIFKGLFLSRRDAFIKEIKKSELLQFSVPQGGMFLLINIEKTGLDGGKFAERLLQEEHVAVVPGYGFGESMQNTIRIGFLDEIPRLIEAARRLRRFAESL